MNARKMPLIALLITIPAFVGAAPVLAGQVQTQPGPTPEADALAADMRILGSNPFDLAALISAGERTLKLEDLDAAAAFFQRAERISPNDGRIKAGKARAFIQLGRPGEALRFFAEAEALGYDVDAIGAERGLAYDLIGEQERAQRTYRRALKRGADDETQRRYALSLGISGEREKALAQIDGLLRRSDRAAWRVRAFILAMSGDIAGAERIATSMLPDSMASGLAPFFRILPTLGPADRAFAVHFGEVRRSPERIADAKMIPVLPPLPYEAPPVVQVAKLPAPVPSRGQAKRNRRGRNAPVDVAALVPRDLPPALPSPPSLRDMAPLPTDMTVESPPHIPVSYPPAVPTVRRDPPRPAAAVEVARAPMNQGARGDTPLPVAQTTTPSAPNGPVPAGPPVALANSNGPAGTVLTREEDASVSPPTAVAANSVERLAVATALANVPPTPSVDKSRPRPVVAERSILDRIIAGIGVPASELDVGAAAALPDPVPADGDARKQAAIDKRAAEKKAAADKAAAEKKLADKKAAEEKAAKAKAEKAAPARIWVQVAGGSSVRDLPKEWARLRAKAQANFRSRSAYTTPLRFTNRLLTGPFKSEDEAQNFVNQIAKSGLTGFVFTSDAGQKIDKLPTK